MIFNFKKNVSFMSYRFREVV